MIKCFLCMAYIKTTTNQNLPLKIKHNLHANFQEQQAIYICLKIMICNVYVCIWCFNIIGKVYILCAYIPVIGNKHYILDVYAETYALSLEDWELSKA